MVVMQCEISVTKYILSTVIALVAFDESPALTNSLLAHTLSLIDKK